MPFSFTEIQGSLGQATNDSETAITTSLADIDPNSSADLMELQFLLQQWGVATNAQSATLKTLGDGLKGITQRM